MANNISTAKASPGTFWGGTLITFLLLSACGGNNSNINSQDVGGLRVINAISDSPALTFTLETTNLTALLYGQASGFTSIRDGRYDLTVRYTGLDNQTVTVFDDERVRIRVEEQTTIVVAGTLAAPVFLEIEVENPDIATTASELIVVNTAGVGSVDAYLGAPAAELGSPVASVPANTASPIVATDAGTRRLRVTTAGSTEVIYDSGAFELPGGQRVLLHIQPYFGPGDAAITATAIDSVRTNTFANEDLPATIRVANAVADLPAIDVAISGDGDTTTLDGVPLNTLSDPLSFAPGAKDIQANLETDPASAFYDDNSTLIAGERRTLLVAGNFSNNTATARLAVDPQRPISTSAQLNFMHGAIDSGRIDLYLLTDGATTSDATPVTPNLALLANTNLEVLAGTYDLVVTRTDEEAALAGPVSINLANNRLYTVLITDADGGGIPPRIILGNNFE